MRDTLLTPGEPAPWFMAASPSVPQFHFNSVAGRYVLLCFFGSAAAEPGRRVLADFTALRARFDDETVCFFGVSTDPADRESGRVRDELPGVRFFWDFDSAVSRQFAATGPGGECRPCTYLLDERLRVYCALPIDPARPEAHVPFLSQVLYNLPPIPPAEPARPQAPVLVVPRVFEPDLCRALIDHYRRHGGQESGVMRQVGGRTVPVCDPDFKRRRDQEIQDEPLRAAAMARVADRLVPEVHRAFQFRATRIERHIVACYDAVAGGFFRPHRDNTTAGTAHRRFAVSLNLNTGEYAGGLLRFPEFGRQTYVAPVGGAVVFSCSLLHEATPVTAGRRFAYLPFLYDEAAARVREQNLHAVAAGPAGRP